MPTIVELGEEQYYSFVKLITEVGFDIDGENLTISADLEQLEHLQSITISQLKLNQQFSNEGFAGTIDSVNRSIEQSSNINKTISLLLQNNLYSINNNIIENRKSNIKSFNDLSAVIGSVGTENHNDLMILNSTLHNELMNINNTLGATYLLEKQETEAIASTFYSYLEKMNDVLSTIQTTIDVLQAALGLLSNWFQSTQVGVMENQLITQQRTNALLEQLIEAFDTFKAEIPAKVLETIAASEFEIEAGATVGTEMFFDACEYDPLGFGPINCDGLEATEVVLNVVKIEGVLVN